MKEKQEILLSEASDTIICALAKFYGFDIDDKNIIEKIIDQSYLDQMPPVCGTYYKRFVATGLKICEQTGELPVYVRKQYQKEIIEGG